MRLACACGKNLRVNDALIGKRVKCPACGATIRVEADDIVDQPATSPIAVVPRKRAPAPADEDEAPPSKKRPRIDDEEEESPPPRKKRPADDEEDEVPPPNKKRPVAADEEEESPRKRQRDEDDETPRKKKGKRKAGSGLLWIALGGGALALVL